MDVAATFAFTPVDPTPDVSPEAPPDPDLGPLELLIGSWKGTGFNAIWRPSSVPNQDRFLELNVTNETLDFSRIPGNIPNRGLLQPDIFMFGANYLQQITDANQSDGAGNPAGLHLEPGLWVTVPPTTDPQVPASVARLASIPHGTSIVAQGTGLTVDGGPKIDPVDLNPFTIGDPSTARPFPEQDLSTPTAFRTPDEFLKGVTQEIVNDPNKVIRDAVAQQKITSTVVLQITTAQQPIPGGGTANTAFLKGGPDGPNADAVEVTAVFWIEKVQTPDGEQLQLQYTQRVLLNFNKLSWPHVTVATLTRQPS